MEAVLGDSIMRTQKRLNVNVEEQKYKELKLKATFHEVTLSELVNSWINSYLVSEARNASRAEQK
jgi:hypothetical protein